ncbi:hypothetical protein Tco_1032591 [Tanacetum coccineum]|uniref:Uncharacterized protein n=1 Tax=Tanacetum coccineum TaxID=301880 RepID=A0ABQ5GDR1_9ASTR
MELSKLVTLVLTSLMTPVLSQHFASAGFYPSNPNTYPTSLIHVASPSAISPYDKPSSIPRPLVGLAVELSPTLYREPRVDKHNLLRDDGSNGDGIGSGDKCAGGVVHLARRSPAEGGDSEIGGDGDGVVMARSLSTSASGGRDMKTEAGARTVNPSPI